MKFQIKSSVVQAPISYNGNAIQALGQYISPAPQYKLSYQLFLDGKQLAVFDTKEGAKHFAKLYSAGATDEEFEA